MLQPIMHILSCQRIVLASSSPRRKQILENVGLKFEVVPSTFEEQLDKGGFLGPAQYAMETALQKTLQVIQAVDKDLHPPDLTIGADTVVAMDNKIFEKPRDAADAFQMLSSFSGRSHTVYTGVVLVTKSKNESCDDTINHHGIHQFYESTEVFMAPMTPEIIKAYIQTGEPLDKAGGYGIQGLGGTLVEKVHGDFFNVMGFPLPRFAQELLKIYSVHVS